jgi:hypothetical protein
VVSVFCNHASGGFLVVKEETHAALYVIPDWHDRRTSFPDSAAVVSRAAHPGWLHLKNTGLAFLVVMWDALCLGRADDR